MKSKLIVLVVFLFALSSAIISNDQDDKLAESMKRGEKIYKESCITCHMANGKGLKDTFPPLASADYLLKDFKKGIKAIKFGQQGEVIVNGITYNGYMAPQYLSDEEVADVMNYILNSWGNKMKYVSPKIVSEVKE